VYDESETIDLETIPLNGGALIKVLELSVDPYFRGRMRDPSVKSYSPPFTLGQPLEGNGVGVVLRSENSKLKTGDHITGTLRMFSTCSRPFWSFDLHTAAHQHYFAATNIDNILIINNPYNLPWSNFIGVLGMPGNTNTSHLPFFSPDHCRRNNRLRCMEGICTSEKGGSRYFVFKSFFSFIP